MNTRKQIFLLTLLVFCLSSNLLVAQDADWQLSIITLFNKGLYPKAIDALNRRLQKGKNDVEVKILLGQAYQKLSQHRKAIRYLEDALKHAENKRVILLALSDSYEALGLFPKAVSCLKAIIQVQSEDRTAYLRLGKIYMQQSEYQKGFLLYKKLIIWDAQNPVLYKNLAICAVKNNDVHEGIQYFKKALVLNPMDETIYIHLSNSYSKIKQFAAAEALCITGHNLMPDSKRILHALAESRFSLEKYSEAFTAYSELVNHGDSTESIFKKYGVCAYNINNFPVAMYALKKAIDDNDPDPLVFYYLGLTFKHVGNYEKAIGYFNKALKEYIPDYVRDVYIQLADAYDRNEKYQQALTIYKQANALYPEWSLPLFYIATIYDKYYADRQPALEYYQLFIEHSGKRDDRFIRYAKERIDKIIEELHFKKK